MQAREMTQQVIELQKHMVDNWDEALALVENQAEASVNWMIDTATWMPEEGRKAVAQWMTIAKEERGRLKAQLDQGLSTVEQIFAPAEKTAPATPKSSPIKPIKKKKETPDESI
jgi:polyhydroxyalkanoate synthesis regulator phasin